MDRPRHVLNREQMDLTRFCLLTQVLWAKITALLIISMQMRSQTINCNRLLRRKHLGKVYREHQMSKDRNLETEDLRRADHS